MQSVYEIDVNIGKEYFWHNQSTKDPEREMHSASLYASWYAKVKFDRKFVLRKK
jgi:hypothetical protein